MTHSIMMAEFIGIPIVLVVLVALILFAALAVGVVAAILFIVKSFRKHEPISSPAAIPTPASTPTQVTPPQPEPEPRTVPQAAPPPLPSQTLAVPKCPQCHVPLPPNTPEGLCPQCLAKAAFPSEPAAEPNRTPPSVTELAVQFPQLEIIELLGVGGMGMVYKARQPKLDRIVALKILPVQSSRDPSFAERFSREARALAKLNHPGIVTIFDFGQTDSYYYFVMEFVDGMNLRQLLRAQKVSPDQALQLVTQICAALQFAHEEGIVHRDIKPENILLNKKGVAKIADFGLAKLLGSTPDTNLTASQMVMGTYNYMAPEQREKPLTVDHRADIYSLGVVFYEMLTGELPIGRFAPPSQKVQVDVRLDEVVLKSLEKEPDRRYQHASDVKTDVETLGASPVGARPPVLKPAIESAPAEFDWHDFATEVGPSVAILALVGFGMAVIHSAWPVIFLFISGFSGHRSRNRKTLELGRLIWIIGVIGLSAYGVWIAKSIWPLVGLLFMFDWGKGGDGDEESTKKENSSGAGVVASQPPAASPRAEAIKASVARAKDSLQRAKRGAGFWKSVGGPVLIFLIALCAISVIQHTVLGFERHWSFQKLVLQIGLPVAFLFGLKWVIHQQQGGMKYADLPPQLRRRLTLQVAGVSLVAALGSLAFFMLVPIRVTDFKEYRFIPRNGQYDILGMSGEFTRYSLPLGRDYDVVPNRWTLRLAIYSPTNFPVSMDVTLPGLQASYESESVHGALMTRVLDRDTLADWLRDEAKLDVASPDLQEQTKQIMALLKSFENLAPHTSQEFVNLAKADLPGFGFGGFTSNTKFDATYVVLIVFFVLLLVGYFGGAVWVVRRVFTNYRKTLAVA